MVTASTHDVEVLDQNRIPLTSGKLEVSDGLGSLRAEQKLGYGHYFLRFADGHVLSVHVRNVGPDGTLTVESRDYPYRIEA